MWSVNLSIAPFAVAHRHTCTFSRRAHGKRSALNWKPESRGDVRGKKWMQVASNERSMMIDWSTISVAYFFLPIFSCLTVSVGPRKRFAARPHPFASCNRFYLIVAITFSFHTVATVHISLGDLIKMDSKNEFPTILRLQSAFGAVLHQFQYNFPTKLTHNYG